MDEELFELAAMHLAGGAADAETHAAHIAEVRAWARHNRVALAVLKAAVLGRPQHLHVEPTAPPVSTLEPTPAPTAAPTPASRSRRDGGAS